MNTDNNMPKPYCHRSDLEERSFIGQVKLVHGIAQKLLARVGPGYENNDCYVERQSFHPDDWYLWTVTAKNAKDGTYTVWTLNLTIGALQIGRYGLSARKAIEAMNDKR